MQTTYICVRVCMLRIPRRPIPAQYAFTLACAYKNAGVPISRCLSATEEPGERHDLRIGAGIIGPALLHIVQELARGTFLVILHGGPYFPARVPILSVELEPGVTVYSIPRLFHPGDKINYPGVKISLE